MKKSITIKNIRTYIRCSLVCLSIIITTLLLSCPVTEDSSGSSSSNGGGSVSLSVSTSMDHIGHRNAIIGITANTNLTNVGIILSDSANDLTHDAALQAQKAYYTRDLTANQKTSVYLSIVNGFTLANYSPDPSVVNTTTNPTALKILQPGTAYTVHIFYKQDSQEKVEKRTFTTEAFPTASVGDPTSPKLENPYSSTSRALTSITLKQGEFFGIPVLETNVGSGVRTVLYNSNKTLYREQTSSTVVNYSLNTVANHPGYTLYEFTNTHNKDVMVFKEFENTLDNIIFELTGKNGTNTLYTKNLLKYNNPCGALIHLS